MKASFNGVRYETLSYSKQVNDNVDSAVDPRSGRQDVPAGDKGEVRTTNTPRLLLLRSHDKRHRDRHADAG